MMIRFRGNGLTVSMNVSISRFSAGPALLGSTGNEYMGAAKKH